MKKKSKKRETYIVRRSSEYDDWQQYIEYEGEDRQRAEEEYDFWCVEEEDCCVELVAEYQLKIRPCKAERE